MNPLAGVTFDVAGNMHGTTEWGGANNSGVVWEIAASGAYRVLHVFDGTTTNANGASGPDGSAPQSAITFDSAGNMYGTGKAAPIFGMASQVVERCGRSRRQGLTRTCTTSATP
jgi:uncharacterized repeat protein (TIGR03803 family)